MGQVWSKANFDGINETGHLGGRGSVLAVTAQNPGDDGEWDTNDDILATLNAQPVMVSIDANPGTDCQDPLDRVRGFNSFHPDGAHFLLGDGSVHFIVESIDAAVYRGLSTVAGSETATVP